MEYDFNFTPVFRNFDLLVEGALLTLRLSAITMALGLALGTICAAGKVWGPKPVKLLIGTYINIIRNTPFLVQLFIIYFGLPALGLRFSPEAAAITGLTVYMGAYGAEIVRAGLEAIPRSQIEAGASLGLSPVQIFRYIILLPAIKIVYPALTSQFILLMLGTSLVSTISAEELFHKAAFLDSRTFLPFEIFLTVSGIYLALSFGFRLLFNIIGRVAFRHG